LGSGKRNDSQTMKRRLIKHKRKNVGDEKR